MSKKSSGINYSRSALSQNRRMRVVKMLESQLKRGTKFNKKNEEVLLTDKNFKRIKAELIILRKRI